MQINQSKKLLDFTTQRKSFGEENPFYQKQHTKETKDKISQIGKENRGWVKNRKTYEGENNPFYGKTHSEETKEKLREKTLLQFSTQGHPFQGKKHSEKSKAKFRENNKGEKNPNFGKKHSEETLMKMKEARKLWWEKKRQQQSEA